MIAYLIFSETKGLVKTFRSVAFPSRDLAQARVGNGSFVIESEEDAEKLAGPLQVAIYRDLTGAGPQRFENRAIGARRLLEALASNVSNLPPEPQPKTEEETTMPDAPRGRTPRFQPDQRIEVLVTANPKKEGKKNHERFAALMAMRNPTVAKAVEAGVTYGDLAYDAEKGFIKVHPTSGSSTASAPAAVEPAAQAAE